MIPYKPINFTYNKEALIELYNSSPKTTFPERTRANLDYNTAEFRPFLEKYNFVPLNDESIELCEMTDTLLPHTNPNNNGLLIFPVSGIVSFNLYSYAPQFKNKEGRPIVDFSKLSGAALEEIKSTLYEQVHITNPIATGWKIAHTYQPIESPAIILVLKIPKSITWEDALRLVD